MWEAVSALFRNYSIIFILLFVYNILQVRFARFFSRYSRLVFGLSFGFMAIISIMNRVEYIDGVMLDGRNGIIVIAGFFWGPVASLIAGSVTAVYRLILGGDGALAGVVSAYMSALVGYFFYHFKSKFNNVYHPIIIMSTLMAVLGLIPVAMLPDGVRQVSFKQFFIPTLMIYPMSITVYSATIIFLQDHYLAQMRLKNMNEALENAMDKRTQELLIANQELQKEIEHRKTTEAELEKALTRGHSANKAKSEFLANMSHEIRTPLNAIIGYGHLIEETQLNEQQKLFLHKMHASSDNLLHIINDILDFSKIEAGQMTIVSEPFNLYRMINKLMDTLNFQAVRKELTLTVDIQANVPEWVTGDEGHLSQVLLNLISNSLKFTHVGSVSLSIRYIKGNYREDQLSFTVEDTGIGIEKEKLEDVFMAFTQADSAVNREFGGTGLGLAISKKLVEHMGGSIDIESEYGKGTKVIVRLVQQKAYQKISRFEEARYVVILTKDRERYANLVNQLKRMDAHVSTVSSISELHANQSMDYLLIDWQQNIAEPEMLIELIHNRCQVKKKLAFICSDRDPLLQYYVEHHPGMLFLFIPKPSDELYSLMERQEHSTFRNASNPIDRFQGKRVLLVEDNKLNQEIEKAILEEWGLVVEVAMHGAEAVDLVLEQQYDLIVMDLHMPIMDGYESAKRIRQEHGDFLPIIAMTADALLGVRDKVLKSGMNGYVSKPIKIEELHKELVKWI